MKYSCCNGDDCVFVEEGGRVTLMDSPIQYDRYGSPVGGGSNIATKVVRCVTHNERFQSAQTELEDAQGLERVWRKIDGDSKA